MKKVGYFNGIVGELESMTIPMCDRTVFYGDGVYDVVSIHNRKPFTLGLHIDRFLLSCKSVGIELNMTREDLTKELLDTAALADDDNTMLYFEATRGTAPRSHEFPRPAVKPNLIITVTPLKRPDVTKKVKLITVEDKRFYYCNVKTVNLLPNVLASEAASNAGCTEAVLHRGEQVTEGSHSSILALKNGKLIAPPLDELILPSITRAVLISLCQSNGIEVEIRRFSLEELFDADEVLVCSTTKHCLSVSEIDGKNVGGKDKVLLEKIQSLFEAEFDAQTGK